MTPFTLGCNERTASLISCRISSMSFEALSTAAYASATSSASFAALCVRPRHVIRPLVTVNARG
eukprot:9479132-Pyramimonas_sp.AAC.1